jgi:tRNA modification GTPase
MPTLPSRQDTIAACSTPQGSGALSVIRVSGQKTLDVCGALLRGKWPPVPRHAATRKIFDADGEIDEAVAVFYKAPASYTGEDTVEISCHGSAYITARTLNAALAVGARLAQPGEFTLRAYLNGRMDLSQAEGVAELIAAETAAEHMAALGMAGGELSGRIKKSVKAPLVELLAQLEVRLDDQDEDILELDGASALKTLASVKAQIAAMLATFASGQLIKNGVRVALVGAPNAGKSSLLNSLLGYGRAIVSPAPGTTRDTIEEAVEIQGSKFLLTDTAGLREHTLDPAEEEGMRRTRAALERCNVAIFLLDGSRPADKCDGLVWKELQGRNCRIIPVINKSDAGGDHDYPFPARPLRVSCKTGSGMKELKEALLRETGEKGSCVLTSARHYECLRAALDETEKAEAILSANRPPLELAAEHVRAALGALAALAGETAPDDVLDVIFSKFCVGK